jgi:hypothetical protein
MKMMRTIAAVTGAGYIRHLERLKSFLKIGVEDGEDCTELWSILY